MEWIVLTARSIVAAFLLVSILECLIDDDELSGGLRMLIILAISVKAIDHFGSML